MQVQSLGQEQSLEKERTNHSSICAWKIPRTRLAGYSPWGRKELDKTKQVTLTQGTHLTGSNQQGRAKE